MTTRTTRPTGASRRKHTPAPRPSHSPVPRGRTATAGYDASVRNGKVVSADLKPDSAQLPWEGGDFDPRDIPFGAAQYADIVHFSKEPEKSGWDFHARPPYLNRDRSLTDYRGTYRFSVLVSCDGVTPATKPINVDYNGDWQSARPYDA
jgi:hypothetical protein